MLFHLLKCLLAVTRSDHCISFPLKITRDEPVPTDGTPRTQALRLEVYVWPLLTDYRLGSPIQVIQVHFMGQWCAESCQRPGSVILALIETAVDERLDTPTLGVEQRCDGQPNQKGNDLRHIEENKGAQGIVQRTRQSQHGGQRGDQQQQHIVQDKSCCDDADPQGRPLELLALNRSTDGAGSHLPREAHVHLFLLYLLDSLGRSRWALSFLFCSWDLQSFPQTPQDFGRIREMRKDFHRFYSYTEGRNLLQISSLSLSSLSLPVSPSCARRDEQYAEFIEYVRRAV